MQFSTTSSCLEERTIVRTEFNLYYTRDENFSGRGETDKICPKDFIKLRKE
jgi:hypothetical protein